METPVPDRDALVEYHASHSAAWTSSHSYDSLNRLIQSTDGAGKSVSYGYDLANNLTALTYPGNVQVTRAYDADNRLQSVKDWLNHTTQFAYDANSNLLTVTSPNGILGTRTYNNADQLLKLAYVQNASPNVTPPPIVFTFAVPSKRLSPPL